MGNYDRNQQRVHNPEVCAPEYETHAEHVGRLADSATEKVFTHPLEEDAPVYSIHWLVPPGRHEYRSVIHEGLRIPHPETTVHLVTGHLHPYAESLELRDVTTDESLFKARAQNHPKRVALALLEHYSSEEGFVVYDDHQYELVAVYHNTTDHDIDAMALVCLYFLDLAFDKTRIDRGAPPDG